MVTELQLQDRLEEFAQACQRAGVKVTHQRLEILREIVRSEVHPTAEAVLEGVKARLPSVALDTVYRTLWLLTDLGLITTLGPRRDVARFDANRKTHQHFICTKCRAVFDVESIELSKLSLADHTKEFGTIADAHLQVYGVCHQCEPQFAGEPTSQGVCSH